MMSGVTKQRILVVFDRLSTELFPVIRASGAIKT
jgi:hypothetical protein